MLSAEEKQSCSWEAESIFFMYMLIQRKYATMWHIGGIRAGENLLCLIRNFSGKDSLTEDRKEYGIWQ